MQDRSRATHSMIDIHCDVRPELFHHTVEFLPLSHRAPRTSWLILLIVFGSRSGVMKHEVALSNAIRYESVSNFAVVVVVVVTLVAIVDPAREVRTTPPAIFLVCYIIARAFYARYHLKNFSI